MNQATSSPTLYLAFELGKKQWRLAFTVGLGQPPRERTIAAGSLTALQREIALAKKRFGLPEDARVLSCYEAGRDGFWLPATWPLTAWRTMWWTLPALR